MTCLSPLEFNPYHTPLEPGISLIEASAGTGKTFSIVMLLLRFIVEKNYSIEQLLVVTFTNAAAGELRERVRSRLLQVRSILAGNPSDDAALNAWVASLPDAEQVSSRLVDALANIDYANIFTIHGFCQRTLGQFALESGQVFDAELLQDTREITRQIAEDYWRIETYERPYEQLALLRTVATTPAELLEGVRGIRKGSEILPETESLDECLQQLEEKLAVLRRQLTPTLDAIHGSIAQQPELFKTAFLKQFPAIETSLRNWLAGQGVLNVEGLAMLSQASFFAAALNGRKFLKRQGMTAQQRKQNFLHDKRIKLDAINAVVDDLPVLQIAFKRGLYQYLQTELEQRLLQSNCISFDSMIEQLAAALNKPRSNHLKDLLQQQYPVALIDEFQDTDPLQWSVFSALVNRKEMTPHSNYLYLIGDPKQAIYRFRGADIYSYLQAREEADRQYSLITNWRSRQALVTATNTLFAVETPFLMDSIHYHPVNAALQTHGLYKGDVAFEQMVLWELDQHPEQKNGYWGLATAQQQIRQHVVKEILSLLSDSSITLHDSPLMPSSIAILVYRHDDALAYQQALADYGVPAVLNSKSSVFSSPQAEEIYHLLHAISRPANPQLLRYALCQSWFGMTGNDIQQLLEQPRQMDQWLMDFQRYHDLWERHGLLSMMRTLLQEQQVAWHLGNGGAVERKLTNIYHILELLQEVAVNQRLGMLKTLEWLQDARQERVIPGGQELRLESDADAVDIVTIHSAKGLEYPIVFCPDLWNSRTRKTRSPVVVFQKDGRQYSDLGSEAIEKHREISDYEEQAEALRLLYVAITRAQFRCYIAWANQRSTNIQNQSPLAHLYRQQPGDSWQQRMQELVKKGGTEDTPPFHYEKLVIEPEISAYYQAVPQLPLTANRVLQRTVQVDWRMSSYSGLAHNSVQDEEIPELPLDKAGEFETVQREVDSQQDSALPKGAHTGNLVHELLEQIPFSQLAYKQDNIDYITRRTELIQRFGVPIKDTSVLDTLLCHTVTTPLAPVTDTSPFTLASLTEAQCLKEMPFYFSVPRLDTWRINQVLKACAACLPLTEQQLQGQLTGFIDLICEYEGRYYVMDYKTNSLPDYSINSMIAAMREHNYGLQYWIYTLVLHRHLQATLKDYCFAQHFGGVRYLFVRGMHPDEPMSGVFQDQPELATLEAFSRAFTGEANT